MNTLTQGFALDELRVEPRTGLVSGPGGRENLDPKVMSVLVLMAERAGQVVLREELLARLWPKVVVGDDALTRCFYELRRQLARAGGDERYRALVETLPKRGYRLNAVVRPAVAATPPLRRRRLLTAGIASVAALAAIGVMLYSRLGPGPGEGPAEPSVSRSIAVLPFLDMSEKGDHGYLSDGVAEEILNQLAQSRGLRVIARTSSFALREQPLDIPQIAAKLSVSHVLEGSVRRSGDRVRITAQLIDASSNAHVWSETYDRELRDLFAIQDEIARSVATALHVTFASRASSAAMPSNFEAYQRFLQAQLFYNRRASGDVERSIKLYQEAVTLDPGYARAWAALAGAYALLDLRRKQREAAQRAVELDPGLAVGHARLAQYYAHAGEYARTEAHFETALALDPDDPLVLGFSATNAVIRGDIEGAIRTWRRLVARDPYSPVNHNNLGAVLMADGHFTEALAEFRLAFELSPQGDFAEQNIVSTLILLGRYEEAGAAISRLPPGLSRDYALALLHRISGREAEAEAALARIAARAPPDPHVVKVAEVYAFRGMTEEAFTSLLERRAALEADRAALWRFLEETLKSPFLRPLHADPRWLRVTERPAWL